jgi:hypothetical protein
MAIALQSTKESDRIDFRQPLTPGVRRRLRLKRKSSRGPRFFESRFAHERPVESDRRERYAAFVQRTNGTRRRLAMMTMVASNVTMSTPVNASTTASRRKTSVAGRFHQKSNGSIGTTAMANDGSVLQKTGVRAKKRRVSVGCVGDPAMRGEFGLVAGGSVASFWLGRSFDSGAAHLRSR